MTTEDATIEEIEAVYSRFEKLLSDDFLTPEEKQSLAQQILEIVYSDNEDAAYAINE